MEFVNLVQHMVLIIVLRKKEKCFWDRMWNFRIGHTEKKVKDRNLKANIDRNNYVKSDLSHVTERNLPYKGK